ncbi:hypothetical protein K8R33_00590 [archaeon]|nr:hypothetical protein [archaeon]
MSKIKNPRGLEGKFKADFGDFVFLQGEMDDGSVSERVINVGGFVLDYSFSTVKISHEDPHTIYGPGKGDSAWSKIIRCSAGFLNGTVGNRVYNLARFESYEVIKPAKETE